VVKSLFAKSQRLNVSQAIHYCKGRTVFQYAGSIVRQRGRRQDIKLILYLYNVFQD